MIQEFVNRFMEKKEQLRSVFSAEHPTGYSAIVKAVIEVVTSDTDYGDHNPDPERIHIIDDGQYQGTLVYVIGAKGYQPNEYWFAKVAYGSCSGCDTLEGIRGYADDAPTSVQVDDYMMLALHIVQGMKLME